MSEADKFNQFVREALQEFGMDTEEHRAALGLNQPNKPPVSGAVKREGNRVIITIGGQKYRISMRSALNLAKGLLEACKEGS